MTRDQAGARRLAFLALLDACRLWLGGQGTDALLDSRLEWNTLERLAFVHNLEPLLHHLRAEGRFRRDDLPAELGERWERAYFENFVFNTRALEIIRPLCDACEAQGLPIALIKGPVIAARVFGDPALRIMVDLDVLCRERDLPAIAGLARQAGFVEGGQTAVYHLRFWHREANLPLELHFRLYEFLPDAAEPARSVLDSVEPCRLGEDFAFPAPAAHFETAIEVAHLVNHDLHVNLKPLLDLAGGLRDLPSPKLLRQTLEQWDLTPEAAIVGGLLRSLFGVETVLDGEIAPPYDQGVIASFELGIERIDRRARGALEEMRARSGLLARIAYLRRLLEPSTQQLEAVSGEAGGVHFKTRLAHLQETFRRGWEKLTHAGVPAAGAPSIKREVFRRRGRR